MIKYQATITAIGPYVAEFIDHIRNAAGKASIEAGTPRHMPEAHVFIIKAITKIEYWLEDEQMLFEMLITQAIHQLHNLVLGARAS